MIGLNLLVLLHNLNSNRIVLQKWSVEAACCRYGRELGLDTHAAHVRAGVPQESMEKSLYGVIDRVYFFSSLTFFSPPTTPP